MTALEPLDEHHPRTIDRVDARLILAPAPKKAEEICQPMNIAAVCVGGYLLALSAGPRPR